MPAKRSFRIIENIELLNNLLAQGSAKCDCIKPNAALSYEKKRKDIFMKTIALYNNKGGVGKTTTAINVANELAEIGRVLVIDFDGQANSSRFFAEPKAGLDMALIHADYSPVSAVSSTRYPNIDILTSTPALNLITAQFVRLSEEEQTANIRKVLEVDGSYDFVILDMPPAFNALTTKVITLCDSVFVPIELGTFAIQGMPTVTNALADSNAKFGGCIVNKFDKENPADTELLALLSDLLGNKVIRTTVPFSRVIKNSFSFRLTAKEYMKWTAAAQAYEDLTKEILERTE